jgi:hypothetical protein
MEEGRRVVRDITKERVIRDIIEERPGGEVPILFSCYVPLRPDTKETSNLERLMGTDKRAPEKVYFL